MSQLQGLDPHVEKFPPPGHITAGLQQNQHAVIRWWPPGSFPNPAGWFGYRNTAHFITMSTPERAVLFEAPGLGLSYPIVLEAIRHRFFEIPTRPWTSDRFEFLVYDSDGTAVLHRSPIIAASKTDWTQYIFPQPLHINRPFYVAVRPLGTGGFPSSGGMQVNYGQSFSFAGTSGLWEQPGYFEDRSGALCYLTGIRVGGTLPANAMDEQMQPENAISGTGMQIRSASSRQDIEILSAATPAGYRLYRNNVLIHSTGVSGPLSFTDTTVPVGLTEYRATATYANNVESARSATAFLLRPDPCAVIIASFPYMQDFPSDFSSQCWIQSGTNPWQLSASRMVGSTTVHPVQGVQFFHLHTSSVSQANQWLILPEINMATLAHPAIRFRFTGIYRANGPRLRVWASTSGSQFTLMWDSHMHPVFSAGASNLQWLSATLNARELANRNSVRIAFQFTGAGEGFFGLDVIEVLSATAITHSLTLSATPEFSGMVSGQGSFLAGQAVTVHATPNAGEQFAGWFRGTAQQSAQTTYSFVMPPGNLALTARFETITTTVPAIDQCNQGFEVFPNPAKDFVHIRFLESKPEALLTLLDPQGRVILQQATGTVFSGHIEQISLTGVRSGVYLLKVETNRGVRVSRLVLSK